VPPGKDKAAIKQGPDNLKHIDKTDSLDILQLQKVINSLLVGGMINVGAIKKSYCGACPTQHAKQFFDFTDKDVLFIFALSLPI